MNMRSEARGGNKKRCRLSWLTNSARVYEPKIRWEGGRGGVSANEYTCALGAQIYFGDLTQNLTHGRKLMFVEADKMATTI
jgi:hypothetical protein